MKTFDKKWEEVHQKHEWGKYPAEEVVRFVARNFYKLERGNVKILDMGCGTGSVTWYVAREGFDSYGFDGSETAIKKAKKRIAEEGENANIIVADAGDMPYDNEFFDGIIDSAVINANSLIVIKQILKECHRVLKFNGKIFSTGLFKVGMTGYGTGQKIEENTYRNITEGSLADIGTIHFFDKNEIIGLWSDAGYKNIKIDSLERTDMGGISNVNYYMVEAEK
jgi:SAM-dependent methyltransferase